MFVVKRLGRNGMWNAVSLIDENGSFRGEAKFGTKEEAEEYLSVYMDRMERRLGVSAQDHAQVKVFDDSPPKPSTPVDSRKRVPKAKSKKRRKKSKIVPSRRRSR